MSLFFFLLLWFSFSHALPPPRGFFYLNCGSSTPTDLNEITYTPDQEFISVGNTTTINQKDLLPILSTLRFFPDKSSRKYCYNFPVVENSKYLVRTTYYYGNFDGKNTPPVFDQIIGGTKWSVVNTTEDYAKGQSSYYEIIVGVPGNKLSVCLAKNPNTLSPPFISALDVQSLEDSMYNSTDLGRYKLSLVTRSSFGEGDEMISSPNDKYNRIWQPFSDQKQLTTTSKISINPSDFWNIPPAKAFEEGFTASEGKSLELLWPPFPLPATKYYVALYFQDDRSPSPSSRRDFGVSINGISFLTNLSVNTNGVMVYSGQWPLSGQTHITLTPAKDSPVGPIINAAEVFQILPIGGTTNKVDVTAMEDLLKTIKQPPVDWSGDPCLPLANSWTGVTCSKEKITRVISLNLTNRGISGSLPPSINKMTALKDLWVGKNKLTGPIPDLSPMTGLETLNIEDNQFTGPIPESLAKLPKLRTLSIKNNKLQGKIPTALLQKKGLTIQASPENMPSPNKTGQIPVAKN